MTDRNLYMIAALEKFRFPSTKGDLTLEQLYDLPLKTNGNAPSLNKIAQTLSALIQAEGAENFVDDKTPTNQALEDKLEIVKEVIALRKAEKQSREQAAAKRELIAKLEDKLEAKRDQALSELSEQELLDKIAELKG